MKILSKITDYNGIEMRSKLEAKYAELFDSLNIEWAYEAEGYKFSDGTCYLPDFYLPYVGEYWDCGFTGEDASKPKLGCYFEVKGIMSNDDLHKIKVLSLESRKPVIIGHSSGKIEICRYGSINDEYKLQLCKACGNVFIQCEEPYKNDYGHTLFKTPSCYCANHGDDIIKCDKSIFTSFKSSYVSRFDWIEYAKYLTA